jgi:hypothetical protein
MCSSYTWGGGRKAVKQYSRQQQKKSRKADCSRRKAVTQAAAYRFEFTQGRDDYGKKEEVVVEEGRRGGRGDSKQTFHADNLHSDTKYV